MSLFGSETFAWEDAGKRGMILWRHPRNIRLNDNIVVREDDWICGGCGEVVPAEHVKRQNPPCFDTFNKGR